MATFLRLQDLRSCGKQRSVRVCTRPVSATSVSTRPPPGADRARSR